MLIFAGLFLLFCLFKTELSIVQQFADGRYRRRRNFDQVKSLFLCDLQSLIRRHNTKLFALAADQAHLLVADLLVDLMSHVANTEAPPKNNA